MRPFGADEPSKKSETFPQPSAKNRPVGNERGDHRSVDWNKTNKELMMKFTLTKTLTTVFLGLSMLIGGSPNSVSGQQSGNSSAPSLGDFSKRSIQGVWLVVVQRKDCQTGDLIGPPGRGLLTFSEGGTVYETTAPGALPPGASFFRSPGHGVWERQSWSQYPMTMISQRLKPDGSFDGWTKVVATFQLSEDGSRFTSLGSFEMISPNGVVVSTGCSLSTGTRLK